MTSVLKPNASELLSQILKERGIKRGWFAKQVGITPNYLSSMLTGRVKLSTDVAIRSSQLLNLPLDIFLNAS
ncbi:helix-turn-helix transcriptional regulator [Limosilactobacillus fermentum]|uniref:helix-turn-helix transcriptional regulator n=1 Tax=Limosilactobacillus fermentum TaxID=1613 RepID=UPI0013C53E45|nr:helix-turn-helix transcriptional regulator [Limosilactobacillus fermentum]MDP8002317.1 helix-turn-helix transcriptional regulator [Enterococcus faecium]QID95013.1 helix-turn-helix domain-containing protein [Limosilactobacillus fermentum]